ALLSDNLTEMNQFMNQVALTTISYFDTGTKPSETSGPERFYHGFVLGMIVDLADRYVIRSNRESGFGRYDVMLEPKKLKEENHPAIIMEFKVRNPKEETTLEDTVQKALIQIREKNYAAALLAEGMPKERIREYGFAFEGKEVLIDGGSMDR
ncbi:MAG: PD-(D/E)XK nuclease domain-containing protein, partial [Lachnospiraceae bacterium]|nr:PD-(D/E)XK nuclease domain-containing protein [Lachnospiraceae bacterium]